MKKYLIFTALSCLIFACNGSKKSAEKAKTEIASSPEEKEREEKYNEMIAKADKAMEVKSYTEANARYNDALRYKPDENYPRKKLEEIKKIETEIHKKEIYRLVISFYSRGEGTDGEAIKRFDNFIRSYKKAVSFAMFNWGREGEIDYCISMEGFGSGEQAEFVNKTRELMKDVTLVNIYEHAKCINKKE
jgi:hypothetical protein